MRCILPLLAALLMAGPAAAQEPLRLLAAGSLRAALTEVAQGFREAGGGAVTTVFAPSGLLRERIAAGEAVDVFASANMTHPLAVARDRGLPVVLFARNRLCALARPGLAVTTDTLLERMLDPALRLGISTPRADPSGDYAVASFARADALRPGAEAALLHKALRLTGGPDSLPPPEGRNLYAWVIESRADLFLTYCTNAMAAAAELPGARMVQLPEALAVGAEYGLVVPGERPGAARLGLFILSPQGQMILARHGFEAPTLPKETLP
jgi:ABC-type molybdate transport system substrate-binding protein